MKFTVELDDFWIDEDNGSVDEQMKRYIIQQVIYDIWGKIRDQIKPQLDEVIRNLVDTKLNDRITKEVEKQITTGTLKPRYSSDPELTIEQHIQDKFRDSSNKIDIDGMVTKIAKGHAEDLKKRYDLLFASQLVSKLQEQGMLKEDVARLLFDKEGA